jgi:hypothetical protein
MRNPLLASLLLALVGCGDPIIGRWERDEAIAGCDERPRFEVLDDHTGFGDYCACDFDFHVEDRGDDRYRFDVDFDGVCSLADGRYDCDLVTEDLLDCGDDETGAGDFVRLPD